MTKKLKQKLMMSFLRTLTTIKMLDRIITLMLIIKEVDLLVIVILTSEILHYFLFSTISQQLI